MIYKKKLIKNLLLFLLINFIAKHSLGFESAALKASILNCYGFFLEISKTQYNKKDYVRLLDNISKVFDKDSFSLLDNKMFIEEGARRALVLKDEELIKSIFQGCYQNIKNFKSY